MQYKVRCVKCEKQSEEHPHTLGESTLGWLIARISGTRLHGSMMGRSDRTSIMKDTKSLTSSNRIIPLNVMVAWILQ